MPDEVSRPAQSLLWQIVSGPTADLTTLVEWHGIDYVAWGLTSQANAAIKMDGPVPHDRQLFGVGCLRGCSLLVEGGGAKHTRPYRRCCTILAQLEFWRNGVIYELYLVGGSRVEWRAQNFRILPKI